MEILSDSGLELLKHAIVKQACVDYEASLRYLRKHPGKHGWQSSGKKLHMIRQRDDCIEFFENGYCEMLCDIDGEVIMKAIRKRFYNHPIRWGKESER